MTRAFFTAKHHLISRRTRPAGDGPQCLTLPSEWGPSPAGRVRFEIRWCFAVNLRFPMAKISSGAVNKCLIHCHTVQNLLTSIGFSFAPFLWPCSSSPLDFEPEASCGAGKCEIPIMKVSLIHRFARSLCHSIPTILEILPQLLFASLQLVWMKLGLTTLDRAWGRRQGALALNPAMLAV